MLKTMQSYKDMKFTSALSANLDFGTDEEKKDYEKTLVDLIQTPDKFIAAPMPNLYFTRDPFASVGEGSITSTVK